jgi:hypothetical protein
LCNHAGLGLGRHAMNLKELHLGPRPRAAALASARDLIVSSCGKRPRGRRENHETKNTTHTNTTAYQCPKKTPKWYLPPKYREIGNTASPKLRRLTAGVNTSSVCVSTGCVGHTSVHSDSGSRAWGSGAHARCVEQQQEANRECGHHVMAVSLSLASFYWPAISLRGVGLLRTKDTSASSKQRTWMCLNSHRERFGCNENCRAK